MTNDIRKHVEALVKKAAEAERSEDAMRFSQAATNAASALCGLNAPCNDKKD
jgi:hypothetical protein